MKTKRKAKPIAKSQFRSDYVKSIIERESKHIRVYGGMCLSRPNNTGFEGVGLGLKPTIADALVDEVCRCLRMYRRDWTAIFFGFYVKDGVPDVTIREVTFHNVTVPMLDGLATDESDKMWDELKDGERISTAWVTLPNTQLDLRKEYDTWLSYFTGHKAYDAEHCLAIRTANALEGRHHRDNNAPKIKDERK